MKIKINKDYMGYKADQEVELSEADAKELIDGGKAVEVKSATADELMAAIDEKVAAVATEAYRKAKADFASSVKSHSPRIVVGEDRSIEKPQTFGEIKKKAFSNTAVTEGNDGYALPTVFSSSVIQVINGEESLLSKTMNWTTAGNSYYVPADKQTTIGSSPVGGAWVTEGQCVNPGNNQLIDRLNFKLNKFMTLVAITNEMLDDNNVGLESWVAAKAANDIVYNINDAIIRGKGSTLNVSNGGNASFARPLGILNSNALVTVSANGSDEYVSGSAFTFADLKKMVSRFYKRVGGSNPVWIIHPALKETVYSIKDDAGRNLYFAPGTVQYAPKESILGFDIVWSYSASSPGSVGDIILADLSAYATVTKSTSIDAAKSTDLYFNCDETAYRFGIRIDGQPVVTSPILGPDGSKYSPFVTLSARS